jgi:hypothetical protein
MATVTSIGPIGARQINNNLYVGRSDLTTIQSAVTAAMAIGSSCVVIPAGYTGADAISAITGGNAAVYLSDQRGTSPQNYTWNGANYVPADFVQAQGFVTKGVPSLPQGSAAFYFNPAGTAGAGTAHIDVTAVAGMGMPALNINGVPSDGTPVVTFMRLQAATSAPGINAGAPEVEMPSQLSLFNGGFDSWNAWIGDFYLPSNKGMTIWARADENAIDFQGETIGGAYDQTIRLNYLGGNVQIGPIIFSAIGDIVGVGDIAVSSIAADDADFDTCEVNNSPVRTFANTPDGPGQGMVWPPDGIPVSLGDHWQNPSIDPATLATWPTAGIPVSTGNGWGTSIAPASLATYPAAGIPVSTGSAWGTPINPADLPRLSLANIFTGSTQTMQDIISNSIETDGTSNQPARTGARLDFLTDHARHISISSGTTAPGGLRFIGLKSDGTAYTEYMTLDSTGAYLATPAGTAFNITAPAGLNLTGPFTASGNIVANSSTAYLANAATPSAARVVAGFTTLVNGTATVTFAKPFAAGQVYVFLSVIGAGAVGATTTPQVWVFGASNTAITINASSATANNTVFYTVYGNP